MGFRPIGPLRLPARDEGIAWALLPRCYALLVGVVAVAAVGISGCARATTGCSTVIEQRPEAQPLYPHLVAPATLSAAEGQGALGGTPDPVATADFYVPPVDDSDIVPYYDHLLTSGGWVADPTWTRDGTTGLADATPAPLPTAVRLWRKGREAMEVDIAGAHVLQRFYAPATDLSCS